jgi:hypothetical protein
MALYLVGISSFGALRGVPQYVTDEQVAAQVRCLIAESREVFAGGAILSVNEGVRSRPDQMQKLAEWHAYLRGGPWAPLAASPLYTSPHDLAKGCALDFGVTMPDGTNRAPTMSEHSWLVARGAQRGIFWTGRDFRPTPEEWHFNGDATRATLPPTINTPTPSKEDDMSTVLYLKSHDGKRGVFGAGFNQVFKDRDEEALTIEALSLFESITLEVKELPRKLFDRINWATQPDDLDTLKNR